MKDVIYIDIEDDITAIIGKVKAAGTKIVALVPPKRIGVLQSVVNLKLLQRAAGSVDKHVVLITSDASLTSLAAGLKMPVAKNLQSRPEIPNVPNAPVANEEVINGEELAVGEVAKSLSGDQPIKRTAAEDISEQIDLKNAANPTPVAAVASTAPATKPGLKLNSKPQGASKIPNFDIFRKRLFLIIGGGALLIMVLVWAFAFAPHATVTITAKTTAVNIDRTLSLKPSLQQSDVPGLSLKPNVQQLKKSVAAEFDATGSKEIGNKASGQVTVTNCEFTQGFTIPAGSIFTAANGKQFKNAQPVSLSGYTQQSKCNDTAKAVTVEAATHGPEYNISAQSYTISGISGEVTASGAEMSGGTKETVTVISQGDVDKAKDQLAQQDTNAAKAELKKQFKEDILIIEESFMTEVGKPAASPAVGEQAKRAKVTVETTYTLIGLPRDDVKTILTTVVNDALKDKSDQQAYSLGENTIMFQNFEKRDGGNYSTRLVTTGYIGPKINTEELAEKLVGKRYGEIQAVVNEIPGVNNVDIKFSPFWVTTAPSKDKIDVRFTVANEAK